MPYVVRWKSANPVGNASIERETTERYISWEEARELEWIVVGDDWGDKKENHERGENSDNDDTLTSVQIPSL